MAERVLLIEPDLLFSSRIESVAKKNGLDVRVTVTVGELEAVLKESVPRMLLVNLDAPGVDSRLLVRLVHGASRLIGYYSHVNSKVATEAVSNGFEAVVPRRVFATRLGEIFANIRSS
jgi:DNA-binding NtrC family response regulator